MKKTMPGQALIAAALIAATTLLAGCSSATKITSNKSPEYTAQPRKIYGLIAIDSMMSAPLFPELGEIYTGAFTSTIESILRDCNVEFAASIAKKEMNAEETKTAAENFNPDVLLELQAKGYRQHGFQLLEVTYDASIHDVASKKMVWRANLVLDFNIVNYRGGLATPAQFYSARGITLAVDLTDQLKKDGVLTSCTPHTPQK